MSFNVKAILIVRADGSDNNGGGFNPGNANFPTDLVGANANTATPTVSSASYTFVAGDVGARVFIQSGTNWTPGWYTITAVNGGVATITASVGGATLYDGSNASGVSTVAGCATVASPTGGVFGVDYSLQASQKISFTDMVIDHTTNTKFTSAANPVGKNFIGNYIKVTSGTGFTVQRVEVVSTASTVATCDKSLGTLDSVGGNGKLGGALASISLAGSGSTTFTSRNDIFIKSGTITLTTDDPSLSGGPLLISDLGSVTNPIVVEGFGTIPKDVAARPIISAGNVTGITVIDTQATTAIVIRNIAVNGNGKSSIFGFTGQYGIYDRCKAYNCTTGFSTSKCVLIRCEITANSNYGALLAGYSQIMFCDIYANTGQAGLKVNEVCVVENCIVSGNTGDGIQVVNSSDQAPVTIKNCSIYNNTGNGIAIDQQNTCFIVNTLVESNGGYGVACTDSNAIVQILNCGGYNNTSGNLQSTLTQPTIGFVTNTVGSFFINAASGDFTLNGNPNAGASAKATGFPGAMPRGLSTGYTDIGAIQSRGGASGRGGRFGGTWRS